MSQAQADSRAIESQGSFKVELGLGAVSKGAAAAAKLLHGPMDCSLPGSTVHGIFQARVLEWVATAFSL